LREDGEDDRLTDYGRFHEADGSHRTEPPPGEGLTWYRDARLHREGHGMLGMVQGEFPELFGT